jgi:hypothetical protein
MNCTKCGAVLDSKARFCTLCGTPTQGNPASHIAGSTSSQRWEYMVWVIGYADTSIGFTTFKGGVVKYLNGDELPNWRQGPRLSDALNRAGVEGWELVSASSFDSGKDPVFIFKRVKP